MKYLSWIFLFPLTILLIVFSVANRGPIAIDLWPFPHNIDVPLFAIVFSALLVGVIWGGVSTWLNGHSVRKAARQMEVSNAENRRLRNRISGLEANIREVGEYPKTIVGSDESSIDLTSSTKTTLS